MEDEKRLIDANALLAKMKKTSRYFDIKFDIEESPTVGAVEVVRCKDCRWARPYERTDGETGYYCHFCGHSFKYGTNWERLFTPIKESDDFCSYGERKDNG